LKIGGMPVPYKEGAESMVRITGTEPNSYARKAGLKADDLLVSLNGNEINDVLDYRFYLYEKELKIDYIRGDEQLSVKVKKGEYDDIGLTFATPLMDKKHSCKNKCIFCFIDQLPRGLRDSLYFKDDDSRLSFLHGNYVTLTNMTDADIDRIIKMHISPINVSVHTTNPDLRVKMMKNPRAGEVLSYLPRLTEAGITVCGQIVLCRGINDGEELDRSMQDLAALAPGLSSVSVVPAGLTDHREGLCPLTLFSPEECRQVIGQVNAFGDKCLNKFGKRIFYVADEMYIRGGLEIPDVDYYEDFEQIENGVGMIAMFGDEFRAALEEIAEMSPEDRAAVKRKISVATGHAAYPLISSCLDLLTKLCYNLEYNVYPIDNNFFGRNITVAGLLTGRDIAEQLSGRELGEELFLPGNMLRADGDLFLDGMSPEELSEALGVKVTCVSCDGGELLRAVTGIE